MEKPEWFGYPTLKKFEDTIIRFDTVHKCDRQQKDGRKDSQTAHNGIGCMCAQHHVAKNLVTDIGN